MEEEREDRGNRICSFQDAALPLEHGFSARRSHAHIQASAAEGCWQAMASFACESAPCFALRPICLLLHCAQSAVYAAWRRSGVVSVVIVVSVVFRTREPSPAASEAP